MSYNLIYTGDYDFKPIIAHQGDYENSWVLANLLAEYNDKQFFEHYDILVFDSKKEMSDFMGNEGVSNGNIKEILQTII